MTTFTSAEIGKSVINRNLDLNQEDNEFLQLKNYILTLENNLKNLQIENNNLKNKNATLEQEQINFN